MFGALMRTIWLVSEIIPNVENENMAVEKAKRKGGQAREEVKAIIGVCCKARGRQVAGDVFKRQAR